MRSALVVVLALSCAAAASAAEASVSSPAARIAAQEAALQRLYRQRDAALEATLGRPQKGVHRRTQRHIRQQGTHGVQAKYGLQAAEQGTTLEPVAGVGQGAYARFRLNAVEKFGELHGASGNKLDGFHVRG